MDVAAAAIAVVSVLEQCYRLSTAFHSCLESISDPPLVLRALSKDISDLVLALQVIKDAFISHPNVLTDSNDRDIDKPLRKGIDALNKQLNFIVPFVQQEKNTLASVKASLLPGGSARDRVKWIRMMPRIEKTQKELRSVVLDFQAILMLISQKGTTSREIESAIKEISSTIVERCQSPDLSSIGRIERKNDTLLEHYKRPKNCPPSCQCPCHLRHYLRSPSIAKDIIGLLILSYGGSRFLSCVSTSQCLNTHQKTLYEVSYYFPTWFLFRAIHLLFLDGSPGGKSISLRIAKTIPTTSPILQIWEDGSIEEIQNLFTQGKASPFDINMDGDTALHYAIRQNRGELCEFLLACRANPYMTNSHNKTAVDLAFDRIISGYASTKIISLFKDFIEHKRQHFTRLHLAVLGLTEDNTETLLQTSKVDINAVDINSRTALYWAVRRANLSALRALLQHGADVSTGRDPIAWSCRERFDTSECLELLLTHKANANGCDSDGHTALHACGITGRNEDFIRPLLDAGAYINMPYFGEYSTYHGVTALGFACLYSKPDTSRILLTYGANPMLLDYRGRSALHLAIMRNQRGVKSSQDTIITALLRAGASLEHRDKDGYSAANFAMLHQDIDSLALLMDAGANITYPVQSAHRKNGYCMLAWPIENHWYAVISFLLNRPEVNAYDLHPTSKDSVLHLMAKYLDNRMLVIFEEAVDLGGFASQSIESLDIYIRTMDEINREPNTAITAFAGLIRRAKAANESSKDVVKIIAEPGQSIDNLENDFQNSYLEDDITHQIALSNRLSEAIASQHTPKPTQISLTEDSESDSSDPDSQISLMHWHSRKRRRAHQINSGFHDSGYASAESGYGTEDDTYTKIGSTTVRQRLASPSPENLENLDSLYDISIEVTFPKGSANQIMKAVLNVYSVLLPSLPMLRVVAAKFMKVCKSSLRPQIASGFIRLTWNCDCGVELYGDFPATDLDAIAELADALGASSTTPSSSATQRSLPSMPSPTYQGTGNTPHRSNLGQGAPYEVQVPDDSHVNIQAPLSVPTALFLELCVNTGNLWQSLGEIDITHVKNDVSLGKKIRERYNKVRGFRIKKHFLLKPVNICYVGFGLESRHKVHILKKNSVPAKKDAYQWDPCPPNHHPPPYGPVPRSVILHWLKSCKAGSNSDMLKAIWLKRLPKKLNESVTQCSDDLPTAWGIHIIEGPDKVWMLWTMICALAVCFGPVLAYVILTKDIQGATGIGGMAVAVLTFIYMLMKIEEWKDE